MSKATGTTRPRPAIKDLRPRKTIDAIKGGATQDQIDLQMTMDRIAAAKSTISNLMKNASDTTSTIIDNLK